MKNLIVILVLCISAAVTAEIRAQQSPQQRTGTYRLTLEDCIKYAMGGNYTRQSMELSVRAAEITLDQSKMERLPNLTASAGETFSHSKENDGTMTGNFGLNTGMTLYNGGSITNTIEQNRLLSEQAGVRNEQYDNALTIDIMSSFFLILGFEELMRYQESLVSESEAQVKDGKVRFEKGTILRSDYLILESQLAANRNSIEETKINLKNELLKLKGLLSMDLNADLGVVVPDTTAFGTMTAIPDMDYYLNRSTASLPDLELLDYGVEVARTGLKISQASIKPTLSLSGGLGTGHTNFSDFGTQVGDRFNQSAGITLSVPIFSRNRNRANIEKSRIELRQAELNKMQGEIDIHQTLAQSYHNVESALNMYRMLTVREEAYRETLRVFRERFKVEQVTPVDLLQQENNYINVLYDYVQSKYSFLLRRKILDVYMGLQIVM